MHSLDIFRIVYISLYGELLLGFISVLQDPTAPSRLEKHATQNAAGAVCGMLLPVPLT